MLLVGAKVVRETATGNDPLPALLGRGFTLGVSTVTPPITGLLNNPAKQSFINPSPNDPTKWDNPPFRAGLAPGSTRYQFMPIRKQKV